MSEQTKHLFKSANSRKVIASIILWIMVALSAVTFVMAFIEMIVYGKYNADAPVEIISDGEVIMSLIFAVPDIIWGFMQFVFIIVFLMWVYRTFKNLIAIKVAGLQHSAGWAVGSYIVPIVNLFIPYIVMKEVYQASLYAKPESEDWKTEKSPKYFLVWWIFYIVGSLLYNVNTMFSFDTMGDYQISAVITIIAEPMLILALICLFFIMRNITKAQDTTLVESMQVDEVVTDGDDEHEDTEE